MARPSEQRLLVLHGLRLKGFALPEALVELIGVHEDAISAELVDLESCGHVQYRDGRLTGWALTADGRNAHEAALAAELDDAGCREDVTSGYKRFLALNPELLAICTRWQLRDVDAGVLNDHSDPDYDAGVIAEIGALHEAVLPICADLSILFERFTGYEARLADALSRVQAGDHDYFTKPMIPSYHTVWMEMHEDLLRTLGIERAAEGEG